MKKLSILLAVMLALLTACVQKPVVTEQETTTKAVTTTIQQTTETEAVTTAITTASETTVTTTVPETTVTTTIPTTATEESITVPPITTTAEQMTTVEPEDIPPWWATGTRATAYEGEPFAKFWLDKTSYPQNFDKIIVNYETTMDGLIYFDYIIEKWTDGKWNEHDKYNTANEGFSWLRSKGVDSLLYNNIYPVMTPGKYRIKVKFYTYMKAEDFVDDGSEYTIDSKGKRTNYYYLEFEITE